MAQAPSFVDWFRGILSYDDASHPVTTRLVAICMDAATMLGMAHKWRHDRPRPSQVSPALLPPIDPPPHASFPSGHATQSMTLALLFTEILGDHVRNMHADEAPGEEPDPDGADLERNPYEEMARRVARNREVMGLHYPSDSRAGQALARELFPALAAEADFQALLARAKEEWGVA